MNLIVTRISEWNLYVFHETFAELVIKQ